MRLRHLNDKSVLEENSQQELTTIPGPLVVNNLVTSSLSDSFDEAKQEWELITHIPGDSAEFVENCELCNHRNYKENWLIHNPNTKTLLKVGSDCIKRFIQFAGTSSQADSNTFFENKQKEMEKELELKVFYREVIAAPLPTVRVANRFKKLTNELLEKRGQVHLLETSGGRLEIMQRLYQQPKPTENEQRNFRWLMSDPSILPVQKETKKFRQIQYKEGSTFKKRSRYVRTTLVNSTIYRNPEKKYE